METKRSVLVQACCLLRTWNGAQHRSVLAAIHETTSTCKVFIKHDNIVLLSVTLLFVDTRPQKRMRTHNAVSISSSMWGGAPSSSLQLQRDPDTGSARLEQRLYYFATVKHQKSLVRSTALMIWRARDDVGTGDVREMPRSEGVLYLSFCLRALASRFQMNFTVREHLRRISFLFTLRKRNPRVSTRILQWLVSDKTFPNPLIYQMANPVNSLRNIITCNLFCYSFYAYTSLSLAAYQQARRELKHGCSCGVQQCNFLSSPARGSQEFCLPVWSSENRWVRKAPGQKQWPTRHQLCVGFQAWRCVKCCSTCVVGTWLIRICFWGTGNLWWLFLPPPQLLCTPHYPPRSLELSTRQLVAL
ncbi:uncharacterized protein LOC110359586 isoform X2 [Columba livia]|uniref:uncharacterized protein LOC110359586 isoform X2 n=1 Tax=Columba livia TaxID=8932 RepID=UPI0031BACA54